MKSKKRSANVSLSFPPRGFAFLEDSLCRCTANFSRISFPFLQSMNIGAVVNLSGTTIEEDTKVWLEKSEISLVRIYSNILTTEFGKFCNKLGVMILLVSMKYWTKEMILLKKVCVLLRKL